MSSTTPSLPETAPSVTVPQTITPADLGEFIRASTTEVFSVMLEGEVLGGDAIVGPGARVLDDQPRVTALLGLTGEWAGSGQIICQPGLACRIASKMLMSEYSEVNDDVLDAMAEIANMIVGNVKTALELRLGPMGLSTPAVIFGNEFETRTAGKPDWVIVPFQSEGQWMTVRVFVAPRRRPSDCKPKVKITRNENGTLEFRKIA